MLRSINLEFLDRLLENDGLQSASALFQTLHGLAGIRHLLSLLKAGGLLTLAAESGTTRANNASMDGARHAVHDLHVELGDLEIFVD